MIKCEYEDCKEEAEGTVYSQKRDEVLKACHKHAKVIGDEGNPEYIIYCPACDCLIPVN